MKPGDLVQLTESLYLWQSCDGYVLGDETVSTDRIGVVLAQRQSAAVHLKTRCLLLITHLNHPTLGWLETSWLRPVRSR